MKNPIKNGKEVFAVLSMATVMSISMSVKVDAASELDSVAERSAKAAVERTVKESNETSTESPTSKEEVSSDQDTKGEGKKDTEATEKESSDVTEYTSEAKAETTTFSKDEANVDKGSPTSEGNVEGEDGQVEASEVNDDGVSPTSGGNAEGKDKETDVPQAEDAENSEQNNEDSNLDVSDEKPAEAQRAEPAEPNYSEDEKKIKDYSKEERYRSTQMEQGNGPTDTSTAPDMESKDGFSYKTLEPSGSSEDKTKWGLEMEFDKEKGQRTYTDFSFTNSGNQADVLDTGNISANEVGDKLSEKGNFNDPTYKAKAEVEITGSRVQRNENLYSTEEDLKHINNVNTKDPTIIAWEGKYKKDNANGLKATKGPNSSFTFSVNPWPNENDSLQLMKLNGEYNEKVFVQGQEFDTGIRIDNVDDNAKERLVGQVYHPTTGEIVPGASAYIGENGTIHIKMPKGALKKDPTGLKYVVDDESIFSTDAIRVCRI